MFAGVIKDTIWKTPDRFPSLRSGELHVWLLQIDQSQEDLLRPSLSHDERERAAKFRQPEHSADFVVCRGALRVLLGQYAGIEPALIPISYTADGKPFLDDRSTNLKFNVSHSQGYALFAFSLGSDVGVDIEYSDAEIIDQGLLDLCLHDNELETYYSLPADDKSAFFFKCWTRKEAYLKLRGDGFAISPTKIDLLSSRENKLGSGENRVCFTGLPQIDAYSAVVATKDKPQNIGCYKLGSSLFK